MTQVEIQAAIRNFVITELIKGAHGKTLKNADSLLRCAGIDSVSILELQAFVDIQFGVRMDSKDVSKENFDSIERLAAYVQGKLAGPGEHPQQLAA
jgi:acyl carrier protein